MEDNTSYRINRLEKEMKENSEEVAELKTSVATMAEKLVTIFKRIDTIEGSFQWINRLVIGALITGVIGAITSMLTGLFRG